MPIREDFKDASFFRVFEIFLLKESFAWADLFSVVDSQCRAGVLQRALKYAYSPAIALCILGYLVDSVLMRYGTLNPG